MNILAVQSYSNRPCNTNYKSRSHQNTQIAFKSNPMPELTNPVLKELKTVLSTPEVLELSTQLKQEAQRAHISREIFGVYTSDMVETSYSLVDRFMKAVKPKEFSDKLDNQGNLIDPISQTEKELCDRIGSKVFPSGGTAQRFYYDKNHAIDDILFCNLMSNHVVMKKEIDDCSPYEYRRGLQQFVAGIKQLQELLGVKGGEFEPYDKMIIA